MCTLCDQGRPQDHSASKPSQLGRRDFLKLSTAGAASAAGMSLFAAPPARADDGDGPPEDSGRRGRRYVIRGGHVMSMDPGVGNFVNGDVLVEGKKILAVGHNLPVSGGAGVIDARGKIVMPGFVDTHHHQFETAIRSFIADGLLFPDGAPHGEINYFVYILGTFAGHYRPQDVYISELFGSLSQLDAGVTRRTTSRRSTIRRSIPRPRSRAARTPGGASSSASSRARALTWCRRRVCGIRKVRSSSGTNTFRPATS